MKKKTKTGKRKLLAVLAVPLAALSGCSASVESFLSPPKLSGEQLDIYEALRTSMSGDIHLKYPRSGQYRSAFVVKNIDGEPTDEAIVFYETSNIADGGSSLRLNFLDMENGKWVSVYDFAALGSDIERVQFADLGDGETSIIISYTIQNSSDSAASVLKYRDGVPTEVYTGRCAHIQLMDVNEDGHDELFQISRDLDSGTATASLLGWNEENSFQILSSAQLSGFAELKSVKLGVCDSYGTRALFIDRSIADGSIGTDVLTCIGAKLSAAEPAARISRRTNSYTPDIASQDIDGDGILEIAATSAFPGYENLTRPEQVCQVAWYQLDDRGYTMRRDMLTYISIRSDYMLIIPSRWEGLVTVNVSISEGKVTFSRYNSSEHTAGEELLAIRAVPASGAEPEGYEPFGNSEATGYRFYIRNHPENSLALTDAELADCFRVLTAGG